MRTRWICGRLHAALGLMITLGLQACGCNVVGCYDGLLVQLQPRPTGPYRVELLVDGVSQPAPPEATCTEVTGCFSGIVFRTRATDRVVVRVTTLAGTRDTAYPRLQYATQRPNGRGCDPTCHNATVTADLPS